MASANATLPAAVAPIGTLPTLHIHLDNSLGAAFIGLIFAAILFGVTNVQSLIYYQSSVRDPKYVKWTIAFLWSLDALHLALISHVLYFYMVTNFTNLLVITEPTWSLCLHVLVTTVSDLIVRLYYTRRVWIMSKQNWFLTLGALTFTSVTFVSGMGFGIKIFSFSSSLEFTKLSWVLYTSLGSAVAADLWVAISLCYFLSKNRTGFKSTDTKVNTLIIYIINTGLLTSLCAICSFVSFATMPHNYIFIGFYFSLSKLYFNSLLATLNARNRLREGLSGSGSGSGAGMGVGGGAYQMPRIVSVNTASAPNSKHATSFGTIGVVTTGSGTDSPTRNEFNLGEKENDNQARARGTLPLSVTVRTETKYHTDSDHHIGVGGVFPDKYTSVLPL